jgi:hypothetical protein
MAVGMEALVAVWMEVLWLLGIFRTMAFKGMAISSRDARSCP